MMNINWNPFEHFRTKPVSWLFLAMTIFLLIACNGGTDEAIGDEVTSSNLAPTNGADSTDNNLSSTATIETLVLPTSTPTSIPTETPANEVVIDPDIELTSHHETEDGRLAMNYPAEWYLTGLRNPGETVNNVAISNNSSGYTGNPGQILVQIFEPVYVMELFSIADTSVATLEDIYAAITSGNEPELLENGGEPQILSLTLVSANCCVTKNTNGGMFMVKNLRPKRKPQHATSCRTNNVSSDKNCSSLTYRYKSSHAAYDVDAC